MSVTVTEITYTSAFFTWIVPVGSPICSPVKATIAKSTLTVLKAKADTKLSRCKILGIGQFYAESQTHLNMIVDDHNTFIPNRWPIRDPMPRGVCLVPVAQSA